MNFFTSQSVIFKHIQRYEQQEINCLKTSDEPHLYRRKHSYKIELHFRIIADFESDNEIDNSSKGYKRTNNYPQNPVCNGYCIVPELDNVLQNGYYQPLLGYKTVDWFLKEVTKLDNKMTFHFKNTTKHNIMNFQK